MYLFFFRKQLTVRVSSENNSTFLVASCQLYFPPFSLPFLHWFLLGQDQKSKKRRLLVPNSLQSRYYEKTVCHKWYNPVKKEDDSTSVISKPTFGGSKSCNRNHGGWGMKLKITKCSSIIFPSLPLVSVYFWLTYKKHYLRQ